VFRNFPNIHTLWDFRSVTKLSATLAILRSRHHFRILPRYEENGRVAVNSLRNFCIPVVAFHLSSMNEISHPCAGSKECEMSEYEIHDIISGPVTVYIQPRWLAREVCCPLLRLESDCEHVVLSVLTLLLSIRGDGRYRNSLI
jgi:hypothetical protein